MLEGLKGILPNFFVDCLSENPENLEHPSDVSAALLQNKKHEKEGRDALDL